MASNKRKTFSIQDKIGIIRKIENGCNQADICKDYKLSKSTVCNIWKNRQLIISAHENNLDSRKKLRKADHKDVEEALLKWFSIQRSRNLPVSGQMLQTKANEFAMQFGVSSFICSNGWLDRFKKRNNINSGKIVGESGSVSISDVEDWKINVWSDISRHYEEKNIFNADEAGLFYKMTPNQTLKFKNENCSGGKLSKVRLTVLVCANMNGSEKRKLLVIGKSQKPRCFKNAKNIPVSYKANRKAWMTSDLFEEEIRKWDKELSVQKRKILLLIDNCTSHSDIKNLEWIKIVFLPPNATSIVQPMDQGVIRSLKCHYRKQLILRILEGYEKGVDCNLSLLDAILMLEKSWRAVTEITIRNCFRHAGLSKGVTVTEENDEEDDDLPLAKWIEKHGITPFSEFDMELFEMCDNDVIISGDLSDGDIVEEIKLKNGDIEDCSSDEYEEIEQTESDLPTITDAKAAIQVLNKFLVTQNIDPKVMETFQLFDKSMDNFFLKSASHQPKITKFFVHKT